MLYKSLIASAGALLCLAGSAQAGNNYRPGFDPSQLKQSASATPNQVMVLGTAHLSGLPKQFDPAGLAPLLDRLAAWQPQLISVEALSGAQCDYLRRYSYRYADSASTYCWDPKPARDATGLEVPAASAEMERLLAAWPARPTPAQRRRLAAVMLAAGERASALVQWLRLDSSERRAADGLDQGLADYLDKLVTRRDETYLIAVPLAVRLGLERVYPVDDHTADFTLRDAAAEEAAGVAIQRLWDNPATAKRRAEDAVLHTGLNTAEGVLALYRAYNQPAQSRVVFDSDFGAAMQDRAGNQYGRTYLTGWETRNLRMAANIRDLFGSEPGKRMLTIVGVSHKGYYEAYLNMMHDVQVVDTESVLR